MNDYFLRIVRRFAGQNLGSLRERFRGVRTTKRNILIALTLVLCMRLFFYATSEEYFAHYAHAQQSLSQLELSPEVIDPLNRINDDDKVVQNMTYINAAQNQPETLFYKKDEDNHRSMEEKYLQFIGGTPMEKMAPRLAEKDKEVGAFLVAIAKKESDWGKHAPSKNGKDCYNYWGFKGGYKLTESGYSCFDSPEQAVDMVGDRIQDLVDKKINTPEKMVVWKCGSSCAGHDPAGVKSWIGAVKSYFNKLIS